MNAPSIAHQPASIGITQHNLTKPSHSDANSHPALPAPPLDALGGLVSAMALKRLAGRCGHFWEARYYSTAIAPKDHRRVLNTLRYIHANPKAAGVRKGFYDPYSNYGHYGRLEVDGSSEWHPSFLTLAPTLKGCSKRYERFCQQYRHHSKGAPKCHWGSRMLKRLVESSSSSRSKRKRISPGQMQLPFAFGLRLNKIPAD